MHRQEFHEDLSYARPESGANNLEGINHIHTANIWIQTGPRDPTELSLCVPQETVFSTSHTFAGADAAVFSQLNL